MATTEANAASAADADARVLYCVNDSPQEIDVVVQLPLTAEANRAKYIQRCTAYPAVTAPELSPVPSETRQTVDLRGLIATNARLAKTNAMLIERLKLEKRWSLGLPMRDVTNRLAQHLEQDRAFGTGDNVETEENMAENMDSFLHHTPERRSRPSSNFCSTDSGAASSTHEGPPAPPKNVIRSMATFLFRKESEGSASIGQSGNRGWPWLRSILVRLPEHARTAALSSDVCVHVRQVSGLLSFVSLSLLSILHWVTNQSDYTIILGSFGAEAVLLFAAPFSPFSQPRNVIGGHLVAVIVGVAVQKGCAIVEVAVPLSVSLCIMAQMATDTIHPPGGGAALIAVRRHICPRPVHVSPTSPVTHLRGRAQVLGSKKIEDLGWSYAAPVFSSVALLLVGAMLNNVFVCCTAKRQYPSGGFRKLYAW